MQPHNDELIQLKVQLAEMGANQGSHELLCGLFKHPDPKIREMACSAAGRVANGEITAHIGPCLEDLNTDTRLHALRAIISSGCPTELFIEALERMRLRDPSKACRSLSEVILNGGSGKMGLRIQQESDRVSVACSSATGRAVVDNNNEEGPYTCFGCSGELVFRRPHVRTRKNKTRNDDPTVPATTIFEVRGHFYHLRSGCGESWIHRAAKQLLASKPNHPFLFHCAVCGYEKHVRLASGDATGTVEHPIGRGRIADVAFLEEDTKDVTAVLEVVYRHACDDEKLLDLCELVGTRNWCEVKAEYVVQNVPLNQPVPMDVCSVDMCDICTYNNEIQHQERRTRIVRTRDETLELKTMNDVGDTADQELIFEKKRRCLMDAGGGGGMTVLPFGKYKGVAVETLVQEDVGYILWLASAPTEAVRESISCIRRSRELLKGKCHRCGDTLTEPRISRMLCTDCCRFSCVTRSLTNVP